MNRETLAQTIEEIESLRKYNAILGAKCEVLEIFGAALGLRRDKLYSPDVLQLLKKEYEEKTNEIIGKPSIKQNETNPISTGN